MAIVAKRFKVFDEETNVAITDFVSNTRDIYNSVNNEVKELKAGAEDFIKNAIKESGIEGLKDKIPTEQIREVKQLYGNLKDLTKISTKDIDNAVRELIPDHPLAQAAFNKLSSSCKNKALNKGGLGKPYDADMNCNGKSRKANSGSCNSGGLSNVLGKLTGGAYNSVYSDLNKGLSSILSLASYGYKMNMCGVFGALSGSIGSDLLGGLGKNLLSRASGGLLGELSAAKNTFGILDLAGASAGLHTLLEYPKGIVDSLTNFKIPEDIREIAQEEFGERFTGAMELFDSGWKESGLGDLISLKNVEGYSSDLDNVLSCGRLGNVFSEDALDIPIISDKDVFSAAYSVAKEEVVVKAKHKFDTTMDVNYGVAEMHMRMGM